MRRTHEREISRREFFRQAGCAALGTAASANMIRDLRILNAAATLAYPADYKALVCIFLSGGNDANNLVVPTIQTEYDNYAALRGGILAIPRAGLLDLSGAYAPLSSDGHDYGLHPACSGLRTLFGEGKCALLFNVGTLAYPITSAQYKAKSVAVPPQLFSHSDQVQQWQTNIVDQSALTGWGGRCADLLNAIQPDAKLSLSVSLAGSNTFEVGNIVSQYSVSPTSGGIALSGVTGQRLQAMKNVLGLSYPNLQEQAYATVMAHSINTADVLNTAIAATAGTTWTTAFPSSTLGDQLKMVARIIAARDALSMKRQVFFCSVGGYDTHNNQANADTTTGQHANLLAELSGAIYAFHRALEQIAGWGGEDAALPAKVTSFTASDFGRTLLNNGSGSDHGWGSHHLVAGGAVLGRRTYGDFPALTVNGPDDTSTGRWIPKVAVEQYSATLARWFGVSPTDLPMVFPNLGRFAADNLGFMAS